MKRRIVWLVFLLACPFLLYRIADFTPQPLDAPNTLRPILNDCFIAYLRLFQHPATAYICWRILGFIAMLIVPALAFTRCSRAIYFLAIAVALSICRFPTLLDYQLNPDEGLFLAAAHKLFYNGNFFQAVDCGTSGPLNVYPLMLPAAFGLSPDYASSRLVALASELGVLAFLYASFHQLSSDRIARIALLPAVLAFASLEHPNLVHYSSEQIPLLLTAAASYLAVRSFRSVHATTVLYSSLGLLVGCAFFSKLQSVPIVAAIAGMAVLFAYVQKRRSILPFLGGLLFLPGGNAALCLATGVWRDFWTTYIVSNQRYTDLAATPFPDFAQYLVRTAEIRGFIFTFLLFAGAAAIRKRLGKDFGESKPRVWAAVLAIVSTIAALYAIYKPHRLFPHYLLLLLPPLALLTGVLIIRMSKARIGTGVFHTLVAIGVLNQAYAWAAPLLNHGPQTLFRNIVPTIRPPEGDFIRGLTRPGDRIFVWGWTADPYLGSGRITDERDLNLFYEFSESPEVKSYHLDKMVASLRAHPPALFIDAVGRESWFAQNAKQFNFEQFSELRWFVQINYLPLAPAYGQRYFLRQDLASRATSGASPKHCAASALRCLEIPERIYLFEAALVSSVAYLAPVKVPQPSTLNVDLTPMAMEGKNAIVFGNSVNREAFRGFRFENTGEDRYRLLLGLGNRWASSKPVLIPYGKASSLRIEFQHNRVIIRLDSFVADEMQFSSPLVDSDGPITVGSGPNGMDRFTGLIPFFELDSPSTEASSW